MFKTIQIIVVATLCLNFNTRAQNQKPLPLPNSQAILGKIISSITGEALPGAIIKVTTANHTTVSNDKGEFILTLSNGTYNISISHLNYKTKNTSIQVPLKDPLVIALDNDDKNLQEVEIVSTGYQNIPKERATGSFTLIDNKTLNRTVSPDILSRLKGVTNGLLFSDRNQAGNELGISVRGRSTIFSNTTPLVIVDNFPFEGDLNSLNPDMIESVTILKDAAAASIWGVRAGNGVIVITTKKGRLNQKPVISIKGDLTIGAKPDLYYRPQLTSSEYINIEQFLFDKGAYNAIIDNGYEVISPVIEILQKIKLNPSYALQGTADINAFRNIDSRDQYSDYFIRNSAQQRYFTDLTGGGTNQSYYFSAGYDNNIASTVGQSDSRITLKGSNTYSLFNNRIKINTDVSFSKSMVDRVSGVRGSQCTAYINFWWLTRILYG
jgi:TonB-dependent SusC/RagA subfamily outer membrane receptor